MATRNSVSRRSASSAPQAVRPVSLSSQFKKMLRHPIILLLCIALGAVLAAGFSFVSPAKYEATSTVVVSPLSEDPNFTSTNKNGVDIDTEASVAGSREVAESAAESIDANNPKLVGTIRNSVEVAAHSGTSILDFTATASSPEKAADYANAVADSYLKVRQDSLGSTIESNSEAIQSKIDSLSQDDKAARTTYEEQLAKTQMTSTYPGRVISTAQVPSSSSSLGLLEYLLVGMVAGALVGLIASLIADSRSRKIGHIDRAEDVVDSDVFTVRNRHEVEDAHRVLRLLGASAGQFNQAGLGGTVVYSPSTEAANEFTEYLREATEGTEISYTHSLKVAPWSPDQKPQQTVVTADSGSEISEVLNSADILGSAIFVMKPDTAIGDLEEFVSVAESSEVPVEYVYLQK